MNTRFLAVNPMPLAKFMAEYWEQKPLHIDRSGQKENPFDVLVSSLQLEEILSTQSLFYPRLQLTRSAEPIAAERYLDDNQRVIPHRVLDCYYAGATIVLSQADKLLPGLADLCRDTLAALLNQCQANLYFSPPGQQGFNAHHDTHDVFILQVSGKKTFNFYSSQLRLPTVDDRFDAAVHGVGEKIDSIDLQAGDTLYIPRGWVHDAVSDTAAPSLHVTLGIFPVLLKDFIKGVVDSAASQDVALRRSVSLGSPVNVNEICRLLANLITDSQADAVLQSLADDVAVSSSQRITGDFTQRIATPELSPSTLELYSVVTLVAEHVLNWHCSELQITVRCHGKLLGFDAPMSKTVEQLLIQKSLKIGDISELNTPQKCALLQRLCDEEIAQLS